MVYYSDDRQRRRSRLLGWLNQIWKFRATVSGNHDQEVEEENLNFKFQTKVIVAFGENFQN